MSTHVIHFRDCVNHTDPPIGEVRLNLTKPKTIEKVDVWVSGSIAFLPPIHSYWLDSLKFSPTKLDSRYRCNLEVDPYPFYHCVAHLWSPEHGDPRKPEERGKKPKKWNSKFPAGKYVFVRSFIQNIIYMLRLTSIIIAFYIPEISHGSTFLLQRRVHQEWQSALLRHLHPFVLSLIFRSLFQYSGLYTSFMAQCVFNFISLISFSRFVSSQTNPLACVHPASYIYSAMADYDKVSFVLFLISKLPSRQFSIPPMSIDVFRFFFQGGWGANITHHVYADLRRPLFTDDEEWVHIFVCLPSRFWPTHLATFVHFVIKNHDESRLSTSYTSDTSSATAAFPLDSYSRGLAIS